MRAHLIGSGRRSAGLVLVLFAAGVLAACRTASPGESPSRQPPVAGAHPYVGMWVTADNYIRQELRVDGRYDEARGTRASAYTGRYEVTGDHIDYWDDSGFTADGRFDGDVLHHGGYLFYREGSDSHREATAARGPEGEGVS
ncbi:Atu4866 domain-containing protein [Phytohabitans sp. LJ34]|uniref:Atu4866 domain-containing protein n=1 Tax=Phytohabitans sp. LJ34 TaxID=3452217 RepID=UPI003F8B3888